MIDAKSAGETIALFCRLNAKVQITKPLSGGEVALLFYLDSPGTVHTSVAASSYFMVSKPAISRVVMSLEEKGLVIKEKSVSDARVIELHVTEKGKEVITTISDASKQRIETVRKKVGSKEFDQFIKTMDMANALIAEELGF